MNPFTAPLRLSTPARLVLALAQTLVALLFLIVLTAVASQATPPGGPHTPVTICHGGRTLVVDDDALPAHLAHGDAAGACTPTPTPTPTPTQEVTPWPTPTATTTPTSSPSASPSPEPTSTATVAPTPTATPSPPSSPSPAAPAVTSAPSPGGTASSSSTSTPTTLPDVDTWVGHVGTVDTLAATGGTPSEGVALAAFVVAWGAVMLAIANRNRRRPR